MKPIFLLALGALITLSASSAQAHCGKDHSGEENAVAHCGDCGDNNEVASCGNCETKGCGGGCERCAAKHGKGHGHEGHAHAKSSPKADAPAEFKASAGNLVSAYLDLQEALASDDLEEATQSAKRADDAFNKVEAQNVTEWNKMSKSIRSALDRLEKGKNLEDLRGPFGDLSKSIIAIERRWGLLDDALYMAYCPMALDGKGGHWLQKEKEIANPYYGASMLRCGEIKSLK